MKSNFDVEGMYSPNARYAFTNISDQDFTSLWDGKPHVVKKGEAVEIPHYLAVKFTKELTDSIMQGFVTVGGQKVVSGMNLGVPQAREVWEKKIVRELNPGEESPQIQALRQQLRAELEREMKPKVEEKPLTRAQEFPDAKNEKTGKEK